MNKVLLISHYPPPNGGIASWTKRLLEIGLPDGWEIVHINSNMIRGRDTYENTKIKLGDELVRCFGIWKNEVKALQQDHEKAIKVVHTCVPCKLLGMLREIITGIIAKLYGRKFILHCRCTVPNVVNSGVKRLVFRMLASLCSGIIVLNSKSEEFVRAQCGSRKKIALVPNFVKSEELYDCGHRVYSDGLKSAVYAGGVIADKGCDIILEAAEICPDVTFHLIGNVSEDIQTMNIPANVILYGNQDKCFVQEKLKQADVFLFLSRFWGEGFSNALAEAMSAGLPCIVTDWAANADMIGTDGGVILDDPTADALKTAFHAMDDKSLRMHMGRHNVEKVKRAYVESAVIPQYVKFYEILL